MKLFRFIAILILLACPVSLYAADHYVRPQRTGGYGLGNGTTYNDAFNGFAGISWTNILPGDTLWAGGRFHETLIVKKSGTSGAYISIKSYPYDKALLYGATYLLANEWQPSGTPGVYVTTNTTISRCFSFFGGGNGSLALKKVGQIPTAENTWYFSGNNSNTPGAIYYMPPGGTAPGDNSTAYCDTYTGIALDYQSNIQVDGFDVISQFYVGIRNMNNTATTPSSNLLISNNQIFRCIEGYFSQSNVQINSNIEVRNNRFTYCSRSVYLNSYDIGGVESGYSHQSCSIHDNTVSWAGAVDNDPVNHPWTWSDAVGGHDIEGISIQNGDTCTIAHNSVTGGPGNGLSLYFEAGGRCVNTLIEKNFVNVTGSGILIEGNYKGAECSGNVVRYNLVKYCATRAGLDPLIAQGIHVGNVQTPTALYNSCYNNVVYACANGIGIGKYGQYWNINNNYIGSTASGGLVRKSWARCMPRLEGDFLFCWTAMLLLLAQ